MKRSGAAFLTAALVLAAPAAARDARLTQRLYDADAVVRIDGRMGVQASIAFAEDEHIENVAVGDAESWQITPNKRANLLFVKPLAVAARTNMTVVTDRHTYFFDLVASPRAAAPVYALRFTYPESRQANTSMPSPSGIGGSATASLDPAEAQALNPDEAPVDPAALNFAWTTKGTTRGGGKLVPARLYDDGQAVYASWAPGVAIPAILVANERGDEGPVNFAVRGQTIVIDGVPARIILRMGKDSAQLDYKGPGPKPRFGQVAPVPAAARRQGTGQVPASPAQEAAPAPAAPAQPGGQPNPSVAASATAPVLTLP